MQPILAVMLDALRADAARVERTGVNLVNASTPGYQREIVVATSPGGAGAATAPDFAQWMAQAPSPLASATPAGTTTALTSAKGTVVYCANAPQRVKPGCAWRRHTWCWPSRQGSHSPQPHTNGATTRSPSRMRVTALPVATTRPTNSCPPTCGQAMSGSVPCQPW